MENLFLAEQGVGSIIFMVLLIVVVIAMFVFTSISNKKKQKEAQEKVNSLKIGDRVKTIGGICGFVAEINDEENSFVLETGLKDKKSFVKFDKGAIYQTAPAQGNAVPAPEKKEEKPVEKVEEKPVEKVEEKPVEKAEDKKEEKSE